MRGLVSVKGPFACVLFMAQQSRNSLQPVLPQPLNYSLRTVSWVRSYEPLWLPFLQIYWLTANLSIIHIPNYRLRSTGWRQKSKDQEKERERRAVHHITHWIRRTHLTPEQGLMFAGSASEVLTFGLLLLEGIRAFDHCLSHTC